MAKKTQKLPATDVRVERIENGFIVSASNEGTLFGRSPKDPKDFNNRFFETLEEAQYWVEHLFSL